MRRGNDGESRVGESGRDASVRFRAASGVLGLVFILVTTSRSGAEPPSLEPALAPPLCSGWHPGDGQSRAFDLAATERGYRDFRDLLSASLSTSLKEQLAKAGAAGYDAGLPSCTRGATRRVALARAVPDLLRGRRLWIFPLVPGRMPRPPGEAQHDPDLALLVSKAERVEDLAKATRLLGRPVSLAPKGLAESLGVRCVPALLAISNEGEVEVHEDP
jgi:hypothetical protein